MIEIGYEHSQIYEEEYIPIYKFDNVIFKRIERFICLHKWVNRIQYDNQTGVCTDTLIMILNDIPRELLTNMTHIKHYYKSIQLNFDLDKLIADITSLQQFYNSTFNFVDDNKQKDDYCINNIDLINVYFEKCMVYYNILREIWKIDSLHHFRRTLLDDLYHIMDCREYEKYKKLLMCDGYKTEDLEQLINYGRNIIIKNWREQLSDISTCNGNNSFSFLVHIGYDENVKQNFVSSTLLTNNLWSTYCGKEVGFIMEPKSIVAAYARDVYADNYALKLEDVISRIPVPTILSKQRVEQECIRDLAEFDDGMNEIITEGFNPLALLYIENSERTHSTKQTKREYLSQLRDKFPDLPVVKIHKKSQLVKVLKR